MSKTTSDLIYKGAAARAKPPRHGAHVGPSAIGSPCARQIWYAFRWSYDPTIKVDDGDHPGRIQRIFRRGHAEEDAIALDLRRGGAEVSSTDGKGRQYGFAALGGHYRGSIDGVARGLPEAPDTWHLIEDKTVNARGFARLQKGLRVANPKHYAQVQAYLYEMDIEWAMYIAVCKDNDRVYTERIKRDERTGAGLRRRALEVIRADEPPRKFADGPDWKSQFECRFCPASEVCQEGRPAEVNCRTCLYSRPETAGDGGWVCTRPPTDQTGKGEVDEPAVPLDAPRMAVGCEHYLPLPELVPWAEEVTDSDDDWYAVRVRDYGHEVAITGRAGFPVGYPDVIGGREIGEKPPGVQ